jgi:hypothetical protein
VSLPSLVSLRSFFTHPARNTNSELAGIVRKAEAASPCIGPPVGLRFSSIPLRKIGIVGFAVEDLKPATAAGKANLVSEPRSIGKARHDDQILSDTRHPSLNVENLAVPPWAFASMGLPVEMRNFRYEDMLYPSGRGSNQWGRAASVPDVSRVETRICSPIWPAPTSTSDAKPSILAKSN